ncbi:hypothetical protein JOL79_09035 [Microbispora sp. RL4-1S]|uniref:Uncharacterized protein n=1 Tax=Microbispora oryzae TaxID=2806554 RepID=A0A940WEG1_9ACTN|nr:hypothetical protein [Microbispora oryzae]MBP2703951.1 hypothetical protein [Microbispora oryzae]
MSVDPSRAARGVFRVEWLPGSDQLRGFCHCGAATVADGPVEVWDWLLAHPVGHDTRGRASVPGSGPAVLAGAGAAP